MKANVTDKPVRRFVLMYMYKFEDRMQYHLQDISFIVNNLYTSYLFIFLFFLYVLFFGQKMCSQLHDGELAATPLRNIKRDIVKERKHMLYINITCYCDRDNE